MKLARVLFIISSVVLGFSDAARASSLIEAFVRVSGRALKTNVAAKEFCNVTNGCVNSDSGFPSDPNGVKEIDLELDPAGLEVPGASASGHAAAHAAIGDLGVSVLGFADATTEPDTLAQSFAEAKALWNDRITLSTTRLPFGQTLRATSSIFVDGNLDATFSGKESGSATFTISPTSIGGNALLLPPAPYANDTWGNVLESATVHRSEPIPGAFRVTLINLINSQPAEIAIQMRLSGGAQSGDSAAFRGSGIYAANVSGSLHWGGIESITDEFGNPIDDWTVTSDSGFDYSKPFPVPEPSVTQLVGALVGSQLVFLNRARNKRSGLTRSTA
jgi:hypothetical protein